MSGSHLMSGRNGSGALWVHTRIMNHAIVVLLVFVSVVAISFIVACRNYLARMEREQAQSELDGNLAP